MILIAAVDDEWGIGKKGKMLLHLPIDLEHFKNQTIGKIVVMGRVTFESLPMKKPLKNRKNIVLTKDTNYRADGIIVVNSKEALLESLKEYDTNDIYIIGGEQIYALLLNDCNRAVITKIKGEYNADTYFPKLDLLTDWEITNESSTISDNGAVIQFVTYHRLSI